MIRRRFVAMTTNVLLASAFAFAPASSTVAQDGFPIYWGQKSQASAPKTTTTTAKKSDVIVVAQRAGSPTKVQLVQNQQPARQGAVIIDDPTGTIPATEEIILEGDVFIDGGSDSCCGSCDTGCGCGGYGHPNCGMFLHALFSRSEIFAGVQGYKGPLDVGDNGNFGFHQGFNIGVPLLPSIGLGGQIGGTWTQSDLSGYTVDGFESTDARYQSFFTLGLFQRATECCNWQWGLAVDWLHDEWLEDVDLQQLRGEVGYRFSNCHEFGFWFTTSDDTDEVSNRAFDVTVETTDLYAFYYRINTCEGNEFRLWAGWSGNSDGLLGGDFQMPINDSFALRGGVNYLIPNEGDGFEGTSQESWNVGISFVWYPKCRARTAVCDPFNPLLRPADNSTFMVDADLDR